MACRYTIEPVLGEDALEEKCYASQLSPETKSDILVWIRSLIIRETNLHLREKTSLSIKTG